ncbi:MAG: septum formation initiator family protein [Ginsengibacter sp.]
MKQIRLIFTNKYLLAATAFAIWMLFFDRNNIPLQIQKVQELNNLEKSEQLLSGQIMETREELDQLKNNPATLEKYAREKYMMKKENEDLYIVKIDSSLLK